MIQKRWRWVKSKEVDAGTGWCVLSWGLGLHWKWLYNKVFERKTVGRNTAVAGLYGRHWGTWKVLKGGLQCETPGNG
jgi:hypothetical protein